MAALLCWGTLFIFPLSAFHLLLSLQWTQFSSHSSWTITSVVITQIAESELKWATMVMKENQRGTEEKKGQWVKAPWLAAWAKEILFWAGEIGKKIKWKSSYMWLEGDFILPYLDQSWQYDIRCSIFAYTNHAMRH